MNPGPPDPAASEKSDSELEREFLAVKAHESKHPLKLGNVEARLQALAGADEAPVRWLSGTRILLVDDTPDTLETFGYLLEHEGAVVTPAASGAEALRLAETGDFDLLISDVGMPQMDGYEMMVELRRRPRARVLPAIALTGYGRAHDVGRALAAGFDAHVDKPVDLGQMRGVIEAALAGAPTVGKAPDKAAKD